MDAKQDSDDSFDWSGLPDSLISVEVRATPRPKEMDTEPYWNKWVAYGDSGILSAKPRLQEVMDELSSLSILDGSVTTEFIPPPTGSIEIY